eukprot:TRINITY_DN4360_c0_g1_i3.p1 TRINITY_DN4360_c0_g1~~TRINITY_DN4360_c0_g1_i3.p1  ORF type:complete len:216 (-),score=12.70 TRINITY_DN4360_c0_g1_i3:682-1329(-)
MIIQQLSKVLIWSALIYFFSTSIPRVQTKDYRELYGIVIDPPTNFDTTSYLYRFPPGHCYNNNINQCVNFIDPTLCYEMAKTLDNTTFEYYSVCDPAEYALGSCCLPNNYCAISTQFLCNLMSTGQWYPHDQDQTECTCPITYESCCFETDCIDGMNKTSCDESGGYHSMSSCSTHHCQYFREEDFGACCNEGSCEYTFAPSCKENLTFFSKWHM